MKRICDIEVSDILNMIEKTLNRNGVEIKTDFNVSLSDNISGVFDFSKHDAKIRKEMEYEIQRLMEENARLEKENRELDRQNTDIQNNHAKLYCDTKNEIHKLKEENEELRKDNSRYAGANTMYRSSLEDCEEKNKSLNNKCSSLEKENCRLKDLLDTFNTAYTFAPPKAEDALRAVNRTMGLDLDYEKLKAENEELLRGLKKYENAESPKKCCGNLLYEDDLLSPDEIDDLNIELQDDCIMINDLTTTINVLRGLCANLRKNVGVD